MLRFLAVIFFAFFIGGQANSAETFFDHNGSRISWISDGQKRLGKYFEPRAGLENAGIKPGTILFEGARQGNILSGTAYGFKYGCPPAPYKVLATIASEREFVLRGEAPVFEAGSSCVIARFDAANRNANLTFTFLEPEQGSKPTSELSRIDQPQRNVESNATSTPASSTNLNNSVSVFTPEQLAKAKEASDNTLTIVSKGIELHVAGIKYLLRLQLPSLSSSKPEEAGYYSSRETSPAVDKFFVFSSGTKSVKFDASFYLEQQKKYSTSDSARKCDDTGGRYSTKTDIRSSIGWSSCTETENRGWIYHRAYIRIAPLIELRVNISYRSDTPGKEIAEAFFVNTLSTLDRTTKELRERAVAAEISSKEQEAADEAARNAAAKAENDAKFNEAMRAATRAAEVERSQKLQSSEISPNSATFNIQSSYQYKVQIQFFSKGRDVVWPGAGKAYNLDDSAMKKFRLSCQGGEQICFGGWTTGTSSVTWGVGPNGDKGCKGCCTVCGGSPLSSTLTYTGGGGQQESTSISAADLLGAAIAIGGGVAAAKSGGGGGSVNIPSPSGYSQRGAFDDCAAVNAAAGNTAAAAECRRRATNMGSAPSR